MVRFVTHPTDLVLPKISAKIEPSFGEAGHDAGRVAEGGTFPSVGVSTDPGKRGSDRRSIAPSFLIFQQGSKISLKNQKSNFVQPFNS
jgi:hypothetical protein